jgi:hypothetical protein
MSVWQDRPINSKYWIYIGHQDVLAHIENSSETYPLRKNEVFECVGRRSVPDLDAFLRVLWYRLKSLSSGNIISISSGITQFLPIDDDEVPLYKIAFGG